MTGGAGEDESFITHCIASLPLPQPSSDYTSHLRRASGLLLQPYALRTRGLQPYSRAPFLCRCVLQLYAYIRVCSCGSHGWCSLVTIFCSHATARTRQFRCGGRARADALRCRVPFLRGCTVPYIHSRAARCRRSSTTFKGGTALPRRRLPRSLRRRLRRRRRDAQP